jgi:hypothetical protein
MCAWQVQAQEREVEEKDDIFSMVRIDTIHIKATPYKRVLENGVWKDEDKPIEYYNDIIIYEIRKKETGQASALMTGLKPAIFMLPGGGFFGISEGDTIGLSNNRPGSLTLGTKLALSLDAKVYLVNYSTNSSRFIHNVVLPNNLHTCDSVSNEKGKALALEASYKAFFDLRHILKNYRDSASIKGIDTSNFFMIGNSAGSVLIFNTLFLIQSEIPTSISLKKNCSNADSTIVLANPVRNLHWPIPTFKGVVPTTGAWIYDSIFLLNNNNPNLQNTSIFMLHGTCDELINRRTNKIGFKETRIDCIIFPFFCTLNPFFVSNTRPPSRHIAGMGSASIFENFKNTHSRLRLGIVKGGGHAVFSYVNRPEGAWDFVNSTNDTVTTNVLFNQINPFISGLIAGNLNWSTKTFTLTPSKPTDWCRSFDNVADTVIYCSVSAAGLQVPTTKLCNGSNRFAHITNVPDDAVVTWTVPSWVQIVSGQGTKTLTFKRINAINSTANLTAKVKRECAQDSIILTRSIQSFAVNITLPASLTFSQPIVTPICSSQITSVVNNIPSGATATWTRTGNITINSQNGGSVTYSRTSAINSTGILTLTLTTSCDTMKYNYTIVTKGNIGQGWTFNAGPLGISNICGTTIATQSVEPIPPSTTTTFSVTVTNASSFNIDTLEWEFNCGYISSPPIQTWSGNNLYSEVAVMANALNQGCTNVRVRPRNSCATGSWRTQNLSLQNCGGGFMMILYPNPSSTSIQIELRNDEDVRSLEKSYSLMVVDIEGQPILTTNIEYGKAEIDVSKLKEGQYKAIVWVNDTPLISTFNVSR